MNNRIGRDRKELTLFGIFVVLFILMSILSPGRFFSIENFQSMGFQLPEFGLLTLAMFVVIITGGINLSITSVAALSSIVGAYVLKTATESGMAAGGAITITIFVILGVGLLCGLINGLFISIIGVSPILATLATSILFEGISLNFTKGGSVSGFPKEFFKIGSGDVLGMPIPMVIFIIVIVGVYMLLEYTKWGISTYMIGSNEKVVRFSGISTKKALIKVYLLSGLLCAISGLIMISRYNSAKVDYGSSYLMQTVAAVVLGGVNINGGVGKTVGVIIAVVIVQIITTGLNIFGITSSIVDLIMGVILIGVLTINTITSSRMKQGK